MIAQKNKSNSYKLIIAVLIMSFVLPLIPFSAYAAGHSSIEKREGDCETIVEIEEKREQNIKHFLLPDGSCEAIAYTDAVHRMDEKGRWVDIDNRLYESNKHGYTTEDGRIIFSKKINKNNRLIFTLAEKGYKISFSILDADKNVSAKLSNHAQKYTPSKDDTVAEQYKKIKEIDNTTIINYEN